MCFDLRVIRFRKRYYVFIEEKNWSGDLGVRLQVTKDIPAGAAKYQEWLATKRKSAEVWETLYENFLTVKPRNTVTIELPEFMLEQLPSLIPPPKEEDIDGIYTVDLDREIFSFNHEFRFKLEQTRYIQWMDVVDGEVLAGQVSLPAPVPMESVTDFLVEHNIQSGEPSNALNKTTMNDVSPLTVTAYA